MSSADPRAVARGRITSLDGVRGIAALIVLVHHSALLAPTVARAYLHPDEGHPALGSATWWLLETPLHLFVAGQEAVLVFFVLSGVVLTLPAMRAGFDWFGYFPRRILRLGLPVAGAVVLSTVITVIAPQQLDGERSEWLTRQLLPGFTGVQSVRALDLLAGSYVIDNPLWSLRYELFFSLLLPLAVLVAFVSTSGWRRALVVVGACVVAAVGWATGANAFAYLPAFALGAMLVPLVPRLLENRPGGWGRVGLLGAWAVAFVCYLAYWIAWWLGVAPGPADGVLRAASILGAAAIVGLVMATPVTRTVLAWRPSLWAGRISFSLYLVHVPIIAGAARFLPAERWYLAPLIGIPLSILVAMLFTRWIEEPSHRLSRAAGLRASSVLLVRGAARPG